MTKTTTKRRLKACAYARVSTVRQAERDLSIPDQLRQMQEFCASNGWELVDSYTERGVSGREEDRPEFQRMLHRARSAEKPYDIVLVHSYSRFARDSVVLESACRSLLTEGIKVIAITQQVGDSPEGQLMRGMFGIFDQYSSAQNSKHTLRAMNQCARDGYWPGSHAPDGYRKVAVAKVGDKTRYQLEVDPERAKVIRKIFELAHRGAGQGPMGVKAIAKWLNVHGFTTRKGSRWGLGTVHELLTRTAYIGEHKFNAFDHGTNRPKPKEEQVPFSVPPIVDREIFDSVNAALKARAPQKQAPRLVNSPMLLTGLARCSECGAAMTQATGKGGKYVYYACCNRKRTGTDACGAKSIPQQKAESSVCEALSERVLAPDHLSELVSSCLAGLRKKQGKDDELKAAQREASEAEAGLRRLYDAVARGSLPADDPILKDQIAQLRLRQGEAQERVARCQAIQSASLEPPTPAKLAKFSTELRRRLLEGDPALRKAFLRAFVDRVIISPTEIRLEGRKDVLASAAAKGKLGPRSSVPSFVPEWRARQESNL